MSVFPAEFRNDDGIAVTVFVFFCDGCGKVVRGKKWRGTHRLGIDPFPKGWQETMAGSDGNGFRMGWCGEACEKKVYDMTFEQHTARVKEHHDKIHRAILKCGRRVLGLQPWEKAPWEKGYGK